jgi:hypothetical protein
MKNIFVLGDRNASSVTHRELDAAIKLMPRGVSAQWVGTDTPAAMRTSEADAVWAVSGSPYRNDGAVYSAIKSAREVDSCSAHYSIRISDLSWRRGPGIPAREAPSHPLR